MLVHLETHISTDTGVIIFDGDQINIPDDITTNTLKIEDMIQRKMTRLANESAFKFTVSVVRKIENEKKARSI